MNSVKKARTDLKKIYPKSSLENDCTSSWGRKHVAYVSNSRGIKTFVKNKMNRRMRKANKAIALQEYRDLWEYYNDYDYNDDHITYVPDNKDAEWALTLFLKLQLLQISEDKKTAIRDMIYSNDPSDLVVANEVIEYYSINPEF